jgi:hypothetical protein
MNTDQNAGQKQEKTWKEKKAEADAAVKSKLRRGFVIKPEFCIPGMKFQTTNGVQYRIDANGCRRRVA